MNAMERVVEQLMHGLLSLSVDFEQLNTSH